jgi:hypothetical protein
LVEARRSRNEKELTLLLTEEPPGVRRLRDTGRFDVRRNFTVAVKNLAAELLTR